MTTNFFYFCSNSSVCILKDSIIVLWLLVWLLRSHKCKNVVHILIMQQGNSQKGFGRCRLSCFLHYIHYPFICLHRNSWDEILQTIFMNYPVLYNVCLEKVLNEFGSAVCVQRDRWIVYMVSQTVNLISSEPFSRHTYLKLRLIWGV